MKRFFRKMSILAAMVLTVAMAKAQPDGFNYQAVIRNAQGELVTNRQVSLRLKIGNESGSSIKYNETQKANANAYGVISVTVGTGNSTQSLNDIDWSSDLWLHVEVDINGGTNYIEIGATKLQAVPYAYYAVKGAKGDKGDTGDKGDKGDNGDPGKSFTYCGNWNSEGEYNINDYVLAPSSADPSVNSLWIATAYTHQMAEPRYNTWAWVEFVGPKGEKGDKGDKGDPGTGLTNRGSWCSGCEYNAGDYVFATSRNSESVNSMYIAQYDFTSNDEPRHDGAWAEFTAPAGPKGDTGKSFTYRGYWWNEGTYSQNDYVFAQSSADTTRYSMWIATDNIIPVGVQPRLTWQWIEFAAPEPKEFTYCGYWWSDGVYNKNDYVFAQSSADTTCYSMWIAAYGNVPVGVQPRQTWHWVELTAPKGEKGDKGDPGTGLTNRGSWCSGCEYKAGDYVFAPSRNDQSVNAMYIAQYDFTSTVEPRSDFAWAEFIAPAGPKGDKGDKGDPGMSGMIVEGSQGQTLVHNGTTWVATDQLSLNKLNVKPSTATAEALFEVKDKDGNVVFAVYPDGVRVYIDEDASKAARRSGFLVTGRSATKEGDGQDYFAINADGTQVFVDDDESKAARRSGFLVTGRSATKEGTMNNFLSVNDEGTKVFIDNELGDTKAARRSGFLVTGRSATKETNTNYLQVATDGTQVRFDNNEDKAARRSGFLVTGRSATKDGASDMDVLEVTPDSTRVYVNGASGKSGFGVEGKDGANSNSGFAVSEKGASGNSGYMNVTAQNFFAGYDAGKKTTGTNNTFVGNNAGQGNTTGYNNVILGNKAGYQNSGHKNVIIGDNAGSNNNGSQNVIIGDNAGTENNGVNNVFIGVEAGKTTKSNWNVFVGHKSGINFNFTSTDSEQNKAGNTYMGAMSGYSSTTGRRNTLMGYYAGYAITTGFGNTSLGSESARYVEGDYNTIVGHKSGWKLKTGSYNVYLGPGSMAGAENESNKIRIGGYISKDYGRTVIYGDIKEDYIVIAGTDNNSKTFFVNGSAGGTSTWASSSDARLKKDVQTIEGALDKVLKLRGVSYYWKNRDEMAAAKGVAADSFDYGYDDQKHIGVIAQELEDVFPELVSTASDGFKSVEYSTLAPILIEAIKEQQQIINALQSEKDAQQKEIEELKAQMKEILEKLK